MTRQRVRSTRWPWSTGWRSTGCRPTGRRWSARWIGPAAAVLALAGPAVLPGRAPIARAGSTCYGAPITIIGSEGDDVIKGTSGPDVIDGEGGNDVIDGGGGDDRICGSGGDDRISGGDGHDRCDGGSGKDTAGNCESTTSIP